MKFSLGVTLYNPSLEYVSRINNICSEFDFVYLYDNSLKKSKVLNEILNNPKIEYIFNGENNGLAKAFNYFIDQSVNKYDYLCILDQDSKFTIENIKKMKEFLTQNNNSSLAIAAPSYSNLSLNNNNDNSTNIKVKWVINSGSFLNLNLIDKHELRYDSSYFLDRIDSDFCKMINQKNLDIIVYKQAVLEQELGYQYKNRSAHNPIRHYYIFRDRLYYNNKFYKRFLFSILSLLQSVRHILNIIFFEDEKIKKLKSCFYGYIDFKKQIHGKKMV